MTQVIHVTVEPDHLEGLTRPSRSLAGVAEMIWNALDAEAELVSVDVRQNELEGVETVTIQDDGHGMTGTAALSEFAHLGGSWKRQATHSKNHQRLIHGRNGQGRWRAFSIGDHVTWQSVADVGDARQQTVISGRRSAPTDFEVSESEATDHPRGTIVTIMNVDPEAASALLADAAADTLTATLAPYL